MKHPETQRMLRDIRSGQINGLVFSKLARLVRNTRELLEFAHIFRNAKSSLISLSENIDTNRRITVDLCSFAPQLKNPCYLLAFIIAIKTVEFFLQVPDCWLLCRYVFCHK